VGPEGATPARPPVRPNGDLRVLQLGGGIEVAYCTKVLGDTGAEVAVVEPPEGHELRRRGPDSETSGLFAYLHGGKASVAVAGADLDSLLAGADVLVTNALPDPWDDLHRRHPHLSVVAITPYGLTGPWAGRPATDLTLQAAAGGMAPRGALGEAPLMVGGEPSYWFAGAVAAVTTLGILRRQRATGRGELIDVSIFEAVHLEHGMHPVTFASMAQRPFQTTRGAPVPGIEPTADGHVGFFVITGQQWLDFCALIGRPEWAEDEQLFIATERRFRAEELLGPIREWTMGQTTEQIVEIASLMRIPVAPIGTGATLPEVDQFVAEDWFVQNPDGFVQPRRPYRFEGETIPTPSPAPGVGAAGALRWAERRPVPSPGDVGLPLEGVRVADFTGFWAGPLASGILAGFGADVIHIEGPKRPDGIRMNTIRPMTEDQWWEWSPLFCGANTNKRDLTVDLSTAAGRDIALRLLATCDVMVENFSPRVVGQLGLGPEAVQEVNPDIVIVRMPAFGLRGPWRDRVGFAQTIEQAVGLAHLTGYPGQAPLIPNGMCDPLAGVFGAIAALVGIEERAAGGTGQVVESPMVGAGLNTTAEQVIDYSLSGRLHTSLGNGSPLMSQDVFRCVGEDQWVAVSLPDDTARAALHAVAGVEDLAALAQWCAGRTPQEVTDALWPHGVAVAPVTWAQDTIDNPQLQARGFFESVEHPVCGTHPYVSWPARFGSGPNPWNRDPAPTMGQHNNEILAELGFSADDVEALRADHVIADAVLTDQHGW
jgi:crotonobetainyl-CoA:carnitine CoA-transferase CaiB-like acyl-CoA transferase